MRITGLRSPFLRATTFAVTSIGLTLFSVLPAQASYIRVRAVEYQTCADSLLGKGIAEPDAASACAAALYPLEVSRCVVQIEEGTEIAATDALGGCRQVRRPLELATCVNEIDADLTVSEPLSVLDNCRRSLLPTRFSACVVGLSREIDFQVADAMQTCIAAGDRPRNVLPTFVPAGEPVPTERILP